MKLHFEPDLDYQHAAIEATCGLFKGQETCRTEFTVSTTAAATGRLAGYEVDLGIGNRITLLDDELLANLNAVQLANGLRPDSELRSMDFTIEMETGTGKTYVYLRTILELNRRYGFTKFVIVVPSIAIKEGVYKTLEITREHFQALYGGTPYRFFLYDSARLGDVRRFATSGQIEIMVVTVGSINKKDVNNLYKESEKTNDEQPITLIQATRPVVIVDEPQSVDGGIEGQGRQALAAMRPLCTLRYSATHVERHHMLFKLDAVDAYQRGLVKQIEVASLEVESGFNRPYIKLLETSMKRGEFTAKVELDVQERRAVRRRVRTLRAGDDLAQETGRDIYSDWRVQAITTKAGEGALELSRLDRPLRINEAIGDVNPDDIARLMIRRTIDEHLSKELRFAPRGIKVLSLFFVDAVPNYRMYDEEGTPVKGKYAVMFEEELARALRSAKFRPLAPPGRELAAAVAGAHDGYFSRDRKDRWLDTSEGNQTGRENAQRAYELIMKDKERLLSVETPLRFIFSHSALKEGWDNPNVFQICTLREMGSELQRRQTIGRGLRLCVDQSGLRVRGPDTNVLTVIATEAYEDFAENLQREIEAETGIRFGIVEPHQFAGIVTEGTTGIPAPIGVSVSETLYAHLVACGYVDSRGRVQDALRVGLKEGNVSLPADSPAPREAVLEILRKLAGSLEIRNAAQRRPIKTRASVLESAEFRALWDRIKHRTVYRVAFDQTKLIAECAAGIAALPPVSRTMVKVHTADLKIERGGVEAQPTSQGQPVLLEESDLELPDILTFLQNETNLTRRSLAEILIASKRLADFAINPQQFIAGAADVIKRTKQLAVVDGIQYRLLGDGHYYAQQLFETTELLGYLKNTVASTKSPYEYVIYDSAGVERRFAEALELNSTVKVYAKLPDWFTVPTPLGTYNPDWALVIDDEGSERVFFVVETKGSLSVKDLRLQEAAKIQCGHAHFDAIATERSPAAYVVAHSLDDVFVQLAAKPGR